MRNENMTICMLRYATFMLTFCPLLMLTFSVIAVISINNGTLLMSLLYSSNGDVSTQSSSKNGSEANKCRLSSKNFSGKGKLHKI